jgi:hypothetical protein
MIEEKLLDSILTKDDCEIPRTPEDFLIWIKTVWERIGTTDEIRDLARKGVGLTKPFFEEIWPLESIARHKYLGTSNVLLRPRIGNQDFDAEIIVQTNGAENITRVEFTHTYYDYEFGLRMEYMAEHGHVPLSGHVSREGTKAAGGKVSVTVEMTDRKDWLPDLIDRCEERATAKLQKPYSSNTVLAMVFDDYIFDYEPELSEFGTYCANTLSPRVLVKFRGLFIVGAKDTFWEFPVPEPGACRITEEGSSCQN